MVTAWIPIRFREYAWLVMVSLIAAMLVYLSMAWSASERQRSEQTSANLYWNGYAKLYYIQNGSWNGLKDQLKADRYMLAGQSDLSVAVYDQDGSTEIASLTTGNPDKQQGNKLAILSDGIIVGYTEITMGSWFSMASYDIVAVPVGTGVLVLLMGGLIVLRVRHRVQWGEKAVTSWIIRSTGAAESPETNLNTALQRVSELARKVEQLETVRRTMVADIAHELRTPLAIMRTQLDNALYEGQPLPLERIVLLHNEILRLAKLVQDLQQLSLAESGHLQLEKGWYSLTLLVAKVSETLTAGVEEQGVQVERLLDDEVRLYGDENRIRQVLINLIGNALNHTRKRVRLQVSLDRDSGQAEVRIEDDGWGMEEEELEHIFDRFYRVSSHTGSSGSSTGLGLGLAIARQFAIAHKGTLTANSRFGEGSEFVLRLPIMVD